MKAKKSKSAPEPVNEVPNFEDSEILDGKPFKVIERVIKVKKPQLWVNKTTAEG